MKVQLPVLPKSSQREVPRLLISFVLIFGTLWFWQLEPFISWRYKVLLLAISGFETYQIWKQKDIKPAVILAEFLIVLSAFSSLGGEKFSLLTTLVYVVIFTALLSLFFLNQNLEDWIKTKLETYKILLVTLIMAEALWILVFWLTHPIVKAAIATIVFYLMLTFTENGLRRVRYPVFAIIGLIFVLIVVTLKWGII